MVAEKIDRISRLTLPEAEQLVSSIRAKGARPAIPGLVDLSDLAADADGVTKIVLVSVQELLLELALQMARNDYETRRECQGVQLASQLTDMPGCVPTRPFINASLHRTVLARRSRERLSWAGCSLS